ncbi:MAG: hypothetical protein RMK50_01400 [Nitrososphaerota archaeon]|nr:hypothetical protein [Candidatus Bathyarchaeota archaeon]MDW8193471.1 hypothetical protein [Nitrososphaerota archaeon]
MIKRNMQAREGDLIETVENVIFDVKGLVHPRDKVIAFPRFIPDLKGTRKRRGMSYGKIYSLDERVEYLREKLPHYIFYDPIFDETLCVVPWDNIKKVYKPTARLKALRIGRKLDDLELKALQFLSILKEKSGVSWSKMGISGSLLVGMHTEKSDIDPVIYGSENCRKVHSTLQKLLENGDTPFKPYNVDELRILFEFRSKDTKMNFSDFVVVESRKTCQGKFMGKDYFIRFVKDWNEIEEKYGDMQYKNCGYAKIEATVTDDSEAIFTPCKYKIDNVKIIEGPKLHPISEIVSFRGRFCEQARKNETVIAAGKIENVKDHKRAVEHYRLLIGNKPSDSMILKV